MYSRSSGISWWFPGISLAWLWSRRIDQSAGDLPNEKVGADRITSRDRLFRKLCFSEMVESPGSAAGAAASAPVSAWAARVDCAEAAQPPELGPAPQARPPQP